MTGNKIISMDILKNVLSALPTYAVPKYDSRDTIISAHEDSRFKDGLSEKRSFYGSNCCKDMASLDSSRTRNLKLSSAYEINVTFLLSSNFNWPCWSK